MSDAIEAEEPTPEARAVGDPQGTKATLSDGREWTLAGHVPAFGVVWDRLYDQNVIRGRYPPPDVLTAAYRLLRANYRLTHDEAFGLVRDVAPDALVPAVERALFGLPPREDWRTWSDWVIASCWANGIDPDRVPREHLPQVLEILVLTKRTVPATEYCTAQVKMAKRQAIVDFHQNH